MHILFLNHVEVHVRNDISTFRKGSVHQIESLEKRDTAYEVKLHGGSTFSLDRKDFVKVKLRVRSKVTQKASWLRKDMVFTVEKEDAYGRYYLSNGGVACKQLFTELSPVVTPTEDL